MRGEEKDMPDGPSTAISVSPNTPNSTPSTSVVPVVTGEVGKRRDESRHGSEASVASASIKVSGPPTSVVPVDAEEVNETDSAVVVPVDT